MRCHDLGNLLSQLRRVTLDETARGDEHLVGALVRRWLSGFSGNPFIQPLGAAAIAGFILPETEPGDYDAEVDGEGGAGDDEPFEDA